MPSSGMASDAAALPWIKARLIELSGLRTFMQHAYHVGQGDGFKADR